MKFGEFMKSLRLKPEQKCRIEIISESYTDLINFDSWDGQEYRDEYIGGFIVSPCDDDSGVIIEVYLK